MWLRNSQVNENNVLIWQQAQGHPKLWICSEFLWVNGPRPECGETSFIWYSVVQRSHIVGSRKGNPQRKFQGCHLKMWPSDLSYFFLHAFLLIPPEYTLSKFQSHFHSLHNKTADFMFWVGFDPALWSIPWDSNGRCIKKCPTVMYVLAALGWSQQGMLLCWRASQGLCLVNGSVSL